VSYREAASKFKIASVREKYPEDKLVEEDLKDIQSEILQNVDMAKPGERVPLLRSIFVTTKNLATDFPLTSIEPNLGTTLS
jgi:hypothetical protein